MFENFFSKEDLINKKLNSLEQEIEYWQHFLKEDTKSLIYENFHINKFLPYVEKKENYKIIQVIKENTSQFKKMDLSLKKEIIILTLSGSLKIFNQDENKEYFFSNEYKIPYDIITDFQILPNGKIIYITHRGKVNILDLILKKDENIFDFKCPIDTIKVTPNNRFFILNKNGEVFILKLNFNIENDNLIKKLKPVDFEKEEFYQKNQFIPDFTLYSYNISLYDLKQIQVLNNDQILFVLKDKIIYLNKNNKQKRYLKNIIYEINYPENKTVNITDFQFLLNENIIFSTNNGYLMFLEKDKVNKNIQQYKVKNTFKIYENELKNFYFLPDGRILTVGHDNFIYSLKILSLNENNEYFVKEKIELEDKRKAIELVKVLDDGSIYLSLLNGNIVVLDGEKN
jgi:hypothetical protein